MPTFSPDVLDVPLFSLTARPEYFTAEHEAVRW
jgi:hypothetical protein